MADYYSLLTRAVGALPDATPEARRAIYERARKALLNQLQRLDPPAAEADIARESSALDAAIERIEAERDPPAPEAPEPINPLARIDNKPEAAAPIGATRERPKVTPPAPSRPMIKPDAASGNAGPTAVPRLSRWRAVLLAAVLGLVVTGVAVAAYLLPNPPFDAAKVKSVVVSKASDPKATKIGERISAADRPAAPADTTAHPAAPANATAQATAIKPVGAAPAANPGIPVEQRAALLLQQPGEPGNVKVYVGTVVWRLDNITRDPSQIQQTAVRADVDIPEAKLKASLIFQNNLDPTFAASHTIQVRVTLGSGNPAGGFKAIRVPEMREEGAPSGAPLIGAPATIKENFFLVALQQGDATVARNLDLIGSRAWIDVPMQTNGDKLSKLAIEKGVAGDRVFAEALASWQK